MTLKMSNNSDFLAGAAGGPEEEVSIKQILRQLQHSVSENNLAIFFFTFDMAYTRGGKLYSLKGHIGF